MATTYTKETKPGSSGTTDALTWDDATMSWDDADFTWDSIGGTAAATGYTKEFKVSSTNYQKEDRP